MNIQEPGKKAANDATYFQTALLAWFDQHGRKHLPWQQNKTAYRVWISEIMLQQTQVQTVIPYFERFLTRFPDVQTLANAKEDEVLHLWAGLGYYSRARNLHRAAKLISLDLNGEFPTDEAALIDLPGIGKSTARAILSIAFNQPAAILDGNVKRVLARFYAMIEPLNTKKSEELLWKLAENLTPPNRAADYTQAMMDLGATLCTRAKPSCERCPMQTRCLAHQHGLAHLLPAKKTARALPCKTATFLILKKGTQILLRKRPSQGIWGGLFSLPELPGLPDKKSIRTYCYQQFQIAVEEFEVKASFRHTFSHFHLEITPVLIAIDHIPTKLMEADQDIWYNLHKPEAVGLPKPIQTILGELT